MHMKPEKESRVRGHNQIYGPLMVLNVVLQGPLGPKLPTRDLPFSSGGGHPLDGPGSLSMVPGHIAPWTIGTPNGPRPKKVKSGHRHGKDQNNTKWPRMGPKAISEDTSSRTMGTITLLGIMERER
ncbi:hypothetical protein O181_023506 [Austropuccinia psidii MF-1]|uniref:Uncharacterized protein n=1 Tax=Austropuccinia psidii MF-1 TaxID=1389203 RepID=A0A9Q3GXQ4_9BASI|nr:hypothetical protein [Austropuccinia psidii MF-1]